MRDTLRHMKPDIYTKAVLTVIAIMLTVIAFKSLVAPETANAQTQSLAGVQYSVSKAPNGNDIETFFDSRNGEIWEYMYEDVQSRRKVTLGKPVTFICDQSTLDKKKVPPCTK